MTCLVDRPSGSLFDNVVFARWDLTQKAQDLIRPKAPTRTSPGDNRHYLPVTVDTKGEYVRRTHSGPGLTPGPISKKRLNALILAAAMASGSALPLSGTGSGRGQLRGGLDCFGRGRNFLALLRDVPAPVPLHPGNELDE